MRSVFHFDLENNHEVIEDEDGVEADGLEQAVVEALAGINEMRAAGELDAMGAGWTLVVRNADGTVLRRVPL